MEALQGGHDNARHGEILLWPRLFSGGGAADESFRRAKLVLRKEEERRS